MMIMAIRNCNGSSVVGGSGGVVVCSGAWPGCWSLPCGFSGPGIIVCTVDRGSYDYEGKVVIQLGRQMKL